MLQSCLLQLLNFSGTQNHQKTIAGERHNFEQQSELNIFPNHWIFPKASLKLRKESKVEEFDSNNAAISSSQWRRLVQF